MNNDIRSDIRILFWYQSLPICIKKHKKEGMNRLEDEGLSPTQSLLGIPNLIFWTILSIFNCYYQVKKMYEVNRYQVEDDSLYVYESIWQFLKRSVWQMVSTWNKLSLIQKYKPKRTSWDEIRMKANRQSSTVSALGILKLILKPFLVMLRFSILLSK